ncbi:MAG: phosphoribosylformylglycinamidine cyclo-ligase [Syntrophus sp. (in: bacteria)]|nr:phosphoribosylformylglycinamidine cyclo-ligase [Syntrophus sp. (in: bacteria)]
MTYKDAGVDINKADTLLHHIKKKIQGTFNPFVLNSIGGFAALTEIPSGYKNPVLASSTDGVGTKLKIAFISDKHDTVGIDLVAMSVNDVLTMGAKPYFFLDYFASGRIEDRAYKDVISGICEGCNIAGCALIGGETAEMPSFYKDGEYDLAGFVMGFVEKEAIVNGSGIKDGDVVIGLASSGIHSNGFSLVRKVLLEVHNLNIFSEIEGIEGKLYEELLKPTKIYVMSILKVLESFPIKGMAHITGGGLPGNIGRIIPEGLTVNMHLPLDRVLNIFKLIMRLGNIPFEEMYSTFNMGIGYICIVEKEHEQGILDILTAMGETAFTLGRIEKSKNSQKVQITY